MVNIRQIVFLQEYKKEFLHVKTYGVKFLKCSSTQTMHSIELKFGMYIIDHHPTHCVDFDKFRIHVFFFFFFFFFKQEYKKNSYTLHPMELNYKKYASVYTVLLTKLKSYLCIIDQCSSYYINFGVSSIYSSFYRVHKMS